jgi:hypothetical protein
MVWHFMWLGRGLALVSASFGCPAACAISEEVSSVELFVGTYEILIGIKPKKSAFINFFTQI